MDSVVVVVVSLITSNSTSFREHLFSVQRSVLLHSYSLGLGLALPPVSEMERVIRG